MIPSIWLAAEDPITGAQFAPGSSQDFLEIFEGQLDHTWSNVLPHISVYKVYAAYVANATDDQLRTMFAWLDRHNIALALETGVLLVTNDSPIGWGVEGYNSAMYWQVLRIKELGGNLKYLAMDEPLYFGHQWTGPNSASSSIDEIADQVALVMGWVRKVFPDLKIGDIEPIPYTKDIDKWLNAYERAMGEPLDFFHADVVWGLPYNQQIADLKASLDRVGTRFGTIYNGAPSDVTDVAWANHAIANYREFEGSTGLMPKDVVVQTWMKNPTKILPESADGSLTSIVLSYLNDHAEFGVDTRRPDAPSLNQPDVLVGGFRWMLSGSAERDSLVSVAADGSVLGSSDADSDGRWSLEVLLTAQGMFRVIATATDGARNVSLASSVITLVVDTVAPVVTAKAVENRSQASVNGKFLVGSAEPLARVDITTDTQLSASAHADAGGVWKYDPSALAPGDHRLVASVTDAAGNTGVAPGVTLTVPERRFDLTDVTASTGQSLVGVDYAGPVSYLQSELIYLGSSNVVIGARVANVFLKGGSGDDALAVHSGRNVLDGGTGSNWLVGVPDKLGGQDTFFTDGRGNESTWDTLLNFDPGDLLTLWGFDAALGSLAWQDGVGAPGYSGATLRIDFGTGHGASATVTFAGLTTGQSKFVTATGVVEGLSFLTVARE